ncbi:MAG: outer membrane protein assembly factor BamD [candidate division WOR-3 bacterium]|nr:outer membrane protein assembly factor BamD [candidate division WOR-3 bacterium]
MSKKLFIFFFLLLFACAKKNVIKEENVEELFNTGVKLMEENKYNKAITYFNKIVNEYPHTGYLIKSQFLLAECYFQKKDYEKAKLEYEFYAKTFPYGEDYENALYKSLVCDLKILSKSKNLSALEELKEKFLEFQENYPESKFSNEVGNYINNIDSLIAKNFFDIAFLYYKNNELKGAEIYFEYVKDNFPNTSFKIFSLYFLADIYYKNNEKEKAQEYLEEVIKKGNDELKAKAQKLLAKWKR